MPVPLLDLAAHHAPLLDEIRVAVDEVMVKNAFVLGFATDAFEANLAEACGVDHAIGCSSGTDALLMAMMAYDIGPGDEVIVPTFTFFATAGVVHRLGAKPVFVDIDPATFNVDPTAVEAAINPNTKAIMPVHLYGQCADMGAITAIASKHGIPVIEDAAQAIGARYDDQPAGSIGQIGCLSFYPTKNLGAFGDAGAVLTNDDALAERLRQMRLHGQSDAYNHETVGGNFRIDGIQSAALNVKLRHLDKYGDARRAAACRYHQLLSDTPLTLPDAADKCWHVYNQFTVRVSDGRRDEFSAHLAEQGIGNRVYYPLCLHLQPCFSQYGGASGDCPEGERASEEVLSLPMFPELTETQQDEVSAAVHSFFG